ncbi:MAG: energy-coupling factor transporter transmembrane protein EcfT [Deltaproteobacteria bacterium]|nr:energy-coupling factor transporter transmembrane protein EcfT [Deltaproteobacteria bacterium]
MSAFFRSDDTSLGRLHPSVRLVVFALACAPPLIVEDPVPMLAIWAILAAVGVATGAGANLWRSRGLVAVFLAVTLVLWTAFRRGSDTPYFVVGPFAPSRESMSYGLAMGLRLVAFLTAAIVYLTSTRIEDVSYGMERLGLPYRVAFTLSLAFRLTPLFLENAGIVAEAQRSRGLDVDRGGWATRMRAYAAIVAPVLIAALRQADGMAVALEARGFGASTKRTRMDAPQLGWRDALWTASAALLTGATIAWRAYAPGLFG